MYLRSSSAHIADDASWSITCAGPASNIEKHNSWLFIFADRFFSLSNLSARGTTPFHPWN